MLQSLFISRHKKADINKLLFETSREN